MLQALKKNVNTVQHSIPYYVRRISCRVQCNVYKHKNGCAHMLTSTLNKTNEKILAAVKWPWYFSCNKIDDEPLKALRDFSSSIYWRVRHVHQLFDLNHFNYDQIIYFIFTFWWRQISILFFSFCFHSILSDFFYSIFSRFWYHEEYG